MYSVAGCPLTARPARWAGTGRAAEAPARWHWHVRTVLRAQWALPLSDADSDPGLPVCEHLPDPGPGLATRPGDSAREPRARAGGAMAGWAQARTVGAASPRRQGSAPGGPPSSESRLKVGTWVVLGSDSERPRDHPDQARLPREWPAPVQCCVTAGTAVLGGLPSRSRLRVPVIVSVRRAVYAAFG